MPDRDNCECEVQPYERMEITVERRLYVRRCPFRSERAAAADYGVSLHRLSEAQCERVLSEHRRAKRWIQTIARRAGARWHAWPAQTVLLLTLQELDDHAPAGPRFPVNVRATMLEDYRWYVPFIEVYTSEKQPWAFTGAAHSFATQPELEKYQPLIDAFAREGARPA